MPFQPSLRFRRTLFTGACLGLALAFAVCCTDGETADAGAEPEADGGQAVPGGLNPADFDEAALAGPITEVPCTLSNGEDTTCYRIAIQGEPNDHAVGPFCPRHIDDGPEAAGIWLESGEVYDVDGAFIVGLAARRRM